MDRLLTARAAANGIVWVAAGVAAGTAWIWLGASSARVPHHLQPSSFVAALTMWQAMMIAMMTPAVAPWVAAYARLVGGGAPLPAMTFMTGYFAVWLVYAAAAALLQIALAGAGWLAADALPRAAAGLVLVAAGAYQFLPARRACLTHCRNPLTYFLARWHNGPVGGFRLGIEHGAWCVGCCWALMLTGLALGTMNLAWMSVLTVLVAVEQTTPVGPAVGRLAGCGLIVWGVGLAMS